MTIGLRAVNAFGSFQIDPSYANFVLRGNARTQFSILTPPPIGSPMGAPPPGATGASLIISDNTADEPYFGWGWGYCWLFQSPQEAGLQPTAGPGCRLRNPQTGQLMYDSGHKHLRVVDRVSSFGGNAYSYAPGRTYRIGPLSWGGISTIRDVGDAGMGDGSRLYQQSWRYIAYQIESNVIRTFERTSTDGEVFDGPPGLAGSVGSTPRLDFIVADVSGY